MMTYIFVGYMYVQVYMYVYIACEESTAHGGGKLTACFEASCLATLHLSTHSRDCVVCERSFFYNLKVAQSSLRVTLFVLTLLLSSHQRVTDRRTPTLTSPSDVLCALQLRCWILILFSLEAV